jgi:hypothetical protein
MCPVNDNPASSNFCAVIIHFIHTKTWVLQKSIVNYTWFVTKM